jgi:DNA excision repair protein ERCC-4
MLILIDSREQLPFRFDRLDCETIRTGLPVGDYSIQGHEDRVSIERKNSVDELVMCLSHDRGRFERELRRAASYSLFAVVIEGHFEHFAAGRYRSRIPARRRSLRCVRFMCGMGCRSCLPGIERRRSG